MVLREIADAAGMAVILASIVLSVQLLEWAAVEPVEPDEVDSYELPNPIDVSVQGPGVRAVRARLLDARLRLEREREELGE